MTLPKHEGIYDAIHIDEGHSTEVAQSDIAKKSGERRNASAFGVRIISSQNTFSPKP